MEDADNDEPREQDPQPSHEEEGIVDSNMPSSKRDGARTPHEGLWKIATEKELSKDPGKPGRLVEDMEEEDEQEKEM